MAYDPDTKKRFALPVDPPIPPHMRAGRLSQAQKDSFARTDKLTAKAAKASPAMRRASRRDAKARESVKTVTKAASRSRKETRASSPAADSAAEE
jgi:hypothetical protein